MIQYGNPPVPDVGSQPRLTEKSRMPVMATQKSGALAPASEPTPLTRSKMPPGR